MIPQRTDILPRTIATSDPKPLRKGIFLHSEQTVNPLMGIRETVKPLNRVSGDMRDPWAYMAHLTETRYAYETLLSSPYSRASIIAKRDEYGLFDFSILSGARRKNATRETTSPLKAWLHEHRKNPYPTKGEKIMLAILTKMTLTQISTWFANARRRLKKDNKMTWSPRNKSGDKKDLAKFQKSDKENNIESTSSKDDEEMVEFDTTKDFDQAENKISPDSVDLEIDDDVFSDADSSIDLHENEVAEKTDNTNADRFEEANTIWSKLSHESSEELIKKLGFNGSNSPVGNLQRWVDGHFGNQSPVDFPRELTPPRTPVEGMISPQPYLSKENLAEAQEPAPCSNESECQEKKVEKPTDVSVNAMTAAPVEEVTSFTEDLIRSVVTNGSGLCSQFRSCGLTSHREIDAVLALTTLSSR